MVIRWVPGSIRLVAYYANLMLISSFLGIGLGAMLAERGTNLIRWFPALLALDVLFLGLCRNVLLPGSLSEVRFMFVGTGGRHHQLRNSVGGVCSEHCLFDRSASRSVCSFSAFPTSRASMHRDLGGSLAGTLVFGVFAVLHFSPQIGLAAAIVLFSLLYPTHARRVRTIALFVLTLVLSVVATEWRATWSAYSYLSMMVDGEHFLALEHSSPTAAAGSHDHAKTPPPTSSR